MFQNQPIRTLKEWGYDMISRCSLNGSSVWKDLECRGDMASNQVASKAGTQEKTFRNLVKSDRSQIVFTIFRLICNSKRTPIFTIFRLIWNSKRTFPINRKMVNTIWFRFQLTRFQKVFSLCCTHKHGEIDFNILSN